MKLLTKTIVNQSSQACPTIFPATLLDSSKILRARLISQPPTSKLYTRAKPTRNSQLICAKHTRHLTMMHRAETPILAFQKLPRLVSSRRCTCRLMPWHCKLLLRPCDQQTDGTAGSNSDTRYSVLVYFIRGAENYEHTCRCHQQAVCITLDTN
jgi:hypothetical protein